VNIKFCGKPVTPAQLRRIGFMAVNLATSSATTCNSSKRRPILTTRKSG